MLEGGNMNRLMVFGHPTNQSTVSGQTAILEHIGAKRMEAAEFEVIGQR